MGVLERIIKSANFIAIVHAPPKVMFDTPAIEFYNFVDGLSILGKLPQIISLGDFCSILVSSIIASERATETEVGVSLAICLVPVL